MSSGCRALGLRAFLLVIKFEVKSSIVVLAKRGDVWTPTRHHTALKAARTGLACFHVTQICIQPLSEALSPASSVERLTNDDLIRLHKLRQLTVKLLVLHRQGVAKVV